MWSKFKGSRGSYMLLSLLIAVICWLYVDLARMPDARVTISHIPVSFVNDEDLVEENLLILDEDPTISVTVSGPRSVITKLNRNNITITANASEIDGPGLYSLDCYVALPSSITSASANPVRVTARSTTAIDVTVVRMESKVVPIRAEFTGSVAEQRFYDENSFVLQQTSLQISGEESQVSAVSYAKVVLSESDLTETWIGWLNVILCDQDGQVIEPDNLNLEVDAISVAFYVECMKEVDLTVSLIPGGGATSENAQYDIVPKTITVYGQEVVLNNLETIDLGKIDLSQIVTSGEFTFDIKLPDGVSGRDDQTQATVQVSILGLETQKISVSKVRLVNAPEGWTFRYDPLEVRVRGKAEDLKLLVEDDIQITLDLEGVELVDGVPVTIPAEVTAAGMPELGILGSYSVEVVPAVKSTE